jgi:hypothetical protein
VQGYRLAVDADVDRPGLSWLRRLESGWLRRSVPM